MSLSAPSKGILHHYGPNLTAFEFDRPASNVVLFIGGLTNGYLDVPYIPALTKRIQSIGDWTLIQAHITSSYNGWATGSLKRDAEELSRLVKYLRQNGKKKVVLLGHLTGCQDTMEYLTKRSKQSDFPTEAEIDAAILQAPVSDIEGLENFNGFSVDKAAEVSNEVYKEYITKGRQDEVLPHKYTKIAFGSPISAYRFHSLFSPRGDDDYFSSYLNQTDFEHTFGLVNKPLLVLYGLKDEFVPEKVNRQKLVDEWKKATPSKYWSDKSHIVEGARHAIDLKSGPGALEDFISTVVAFVSEL